MWTSVCTSGLKKGNPLYQCAPNWGAHPMGDAVELQGSMTVLAPPHRHTQTHRCTLTDKTKSSIHPFSISHHRDAEAYPSILWARGRNAPCKRVIWIGHYIIWLHLRNKHFKIQWSQCEISSKGSLIEKVWEQLH